MIFLLLKSLSFTVGREMTRQEKGREKKQKGGQKKKCENKALRTQDET